MSFRRGPALPPPLSPPPPSVIDSPLRLDLSGRLTNSPSIRLNRLTPRDRTSSVDLSSSLSFDQLLAAEQVLDLAQPLPPDDEVDEDSPSARLVPSRTLSVAVNHHSPGQIIRKLSSPGQSSRTLVPSSSSGPSSSHPGHVASSLLSHSPLSNTHSLQSSSSLSPLNTNPASPFHGHGFGRGRSSSFGRVGSPSNTPTSLDLPFPLSLLSSLHSLVLHQVNRRPLRSAIYGFLLLFPLVLWVMDYSGKCHMQSNLAPLLLYTVNTFNAHSIEYWLDYGTLLGAVRSSSIIGHEFDLDLSSAIEECERILQLKGVFQRERGYRMYGRNDWVDEKASFIFGYGGFLHKPCVRIYDPDTLYYIDVDWHQRLSSTMLPPSPLPVDTSEPANQPIASPYGPVYLPRGYTPEDGDVWCNEEGFNGNDPGGCRRDSAVFPLSSLVMYGVEMKVPAHSEEVLRDLYGDSWREPRAKGYKLVVCTWIGGERRGLLWALVALLYIGVPLLMWAVSRANRRLGIIARR